MSSSETDTPLTSDDEAEDQPLPPHIEFMLILEDFFHIVQRLTRLAPKDWPLAQEFAYSLADACAVWDADAKALVEKKYCEPHGITFDQLLRKDRTFVLRRVPRHMPDKNVLEQNVQQWWEFWKTCIDPTTKKPIFGEATRKSVAALIKLIRAGHVSDPPVLKGKLYVKTGVDKHGVPLWRCRRGTSINESLHNKMRECLDLENCSIEVADLLLGLFIDVWNQKAARRNIPGTYNPGHFNTGLTRLTNSLTERLTGKPAYPALAAADKLNLGGEKVGVIRLHRVDPSADLPKVRGRRPWDLYKGWRAYLSKMTGSLVPETPVLTKEEFRYFQETVLANLPAGGKVDSKYWHDMVSTWDNEVDGDTILRKAPSHLSAQFKIFEKAEQKKKMLAELKSRGKTPLFMRGYFAGVMDRAIDSDQSGSDGEQQGDVFGDDIDDDRAAAIARSTRPGPVPHVPPVQLGDSITPGPAYASGPVPVVREPRQRKCGFCGRAGCAGSNLRTRCPAQRAESAGPVLERPASAPPGLFHAHTITSSARAHPYARANTVTSSRPTPLAPQLQRSLSTDLSELKGGARKPRSCKKCKRVAGQCPGATNKGQDACSWVMQE